jgi:hypothetical protein
VEVVEAAVMVAAVAAMADRVATATAKEVQRRLWRQRRRQWLIE